MKWEGEGRRDRVDPVIGESGDRKTSQTYANLG